MLKLSLFYDYCAYDVAAKYGVHLEAEVLTIDEYLVAQNTRPNLHIENTAHKVDLRCRSYLFSCHTSPHVGDRALGDFALYVGVLALEVAPQLPE